MEKIVTPNMVVVGAILAAIIVYNYLTPTRIAKIIDWLNRKR